VTSVEDINLCHPVLAWHGTTQYPIACCMGNTAAPLVYNRDVIESYTRWIPVYLCCLCIGTIY